MKPAKPQTTNELVFYTASELVKAIRDREVSALEVLEAHLDHIARHNPKLNALATLNEEQARQSAQEADRALARGQVLGPMHGLPVTIKDSLETGGLLTTSSHKRFANYIPEQDGTPAARLRAAGAIILAKSNCAELAQDMQTNSPIFGRANNPWDLSRTPGGSTGGGAAAVAAGLSPIDIGSDGSGSMRQPAHFCGIYTLFPTRHLVSGAGRIPPMPGDPTRGQRTFGSFGPLARSVEDLKLALSVIAGADIRDWKISPVTLTEPPERPLREMSFAWTDDFGGVPTTADIRSALAELAGKLGALGCRVERANPPGMDFKEAWKTYAYISGTEFGVKQSPSGRMIGRLFAAVIGDLFGSVLFKGDLISHHSVRGRELNMRRYFEALTVRDAIIEDVERFLTGFDAWLCPVSSTPAFTHRAVGSGKIGEAIDVDGQNVHYWTANASYTTIFNLTGNPVVVLPVARSKQGLPIGIQLVGRRWHDMELLAVGSKLTEVVGPFQRPPGY
jgi:amidase